MKNAITQVPDQLNLISIRNQPIPVPDPAYQFTHLQFRRWFGCPICNTHLSKFKKSAGEIESASIKEVVFFHSEANDIAKFQKDLPFTLVADPHRKIYQLFGVEPSRPKPNLTVLWVALTGLFTGKMALSLAKPGEMGMPADFLINAEGKVVASKFGSHEYDQWSAAELLALAELHSPAPNRATSTMTDQPMEPALKMI